MKKIICFLLMLGTTFMLTNCSKRDIDPTIVRVVCSPDGVVEPYPLEYAVYSNPTSSDLWIEAEGLKNYSLYDCYGQLILNVDIECDNVVISMCDYPTGLYLLRLKTANDTYDVHVTKL